MKTLKELYEEKGEIQTSLEILSSKLREIQVLIANNLNRQYKANDLIKKIIKGSNHNDEGV